MKTAIVDDDPIVCQSLATILSATGAAEVLWTANNGTDAVERYRSGPHHRPDVLLLDIQMPGVSGLDTARRILAFDHAARILFLTTFSDRAYIDEAIAHRRPWIPLSSRTCPPSPPALQAVMAGQVVLGAEVLGKLTEERPHCHDGDVPSNPFPNLSDRERGHRRAGRAGTRQP